LLRFVFRLAGHLRQPVRQLLTLIDWEELLWWQAYYDLEPWGDERADARLAVGVAYQLAPYLPEGTELPSLAWPYYGDAEEAEPIDPEVIREAVAAHQRHWAEWERDRRSNNKEQ
jgi:hypothetical protein